MGDVSCGIRLKEETEEGDGYWGVVSCAGTDGRRGLDEVGVT